VTWLTVGSNDGTGSQEDTNQQMLMLCLGAGETVVPDDRQQSLSPSFICACFFLLPSFKGQHHFPLLPWALIKLLDPLQLAKFG
jgi:hypothetical protein